MNSWPFIVEIYKTVLKNQTVIFHIRGWPGYLESGHAGFGNVGVCL